MHTHGNEDYSVFMEAVMLQLYMFTVWSIVESKAFTDKQLMFNYKTFISQLMVALNRIKGHFYTNT